MCLISQFRNDQQHLLLCITIFLTLSEKLEKMKASWIKQQDQDLDGVTERIQMMENKLVSLTEEETSYQRNKDIAEKKLHADQSRLMEFKAFEAYGESFPQFVLQLTIIIKNGLDTFDGEAIKIFSIVSSYITLILSLSGLIVSLPFYIDGKKKIQQKTLKLQYVTVMPMTVFIVTPRLLILCLFLSMFDLDSAWLCSTILAVFVLSYFFLYWIMLKIQFRKDQGEVVSQTKFQKFRTFLHPFGTKSFDKEENEKGFFITGAVTSLLVPVNIHNPTWNFYLHTNTLTTLMFSLLCFVSLIIVSFQEQYHRKFDRVLDTKAYQIAYGVLFGTLIIGWFAAYFILKKVRTLNFPNLFLWAYENDDEKTFEAMFNNHFDHNATNIEGKGILHLALDKYDYGTMDKILTGKQKVFDINIRDVNGRTVLMNVCAEGLDEYAEKIMHLKGIKMNLQDNTKKTTLIWACINNRLSIVSLFLESRESLDIDFNVRDEDGLSALSHAVNNQCHEIAFLLFGKENIEISSTDKSQMFLMAYEMDKPDHFNKLFDDDSFDHNVVNTEGESLLHLSYFKNDATTFDRILRSNDDRISNSQNELFDVNKADKTEQTVLMHACINGDFDTVEKMFNTKTIKVNQKGPLWLTALMMACLNDCDDIVKLFYQKRKELSVDFQLQDDSGKTAFEMAKEVDSEKVIKLSKLFEVRLILNNN